MNRNRRTPVRRFTLCLTALVTAFLATGCFNPFQPNIVTQRVTTVAPSPSTPQNAVKLFEWCWVNRGVEEYKGLFTADYVFQSAELDSAGNTSRDVLTRRNDEIETAENMFIGSAERPPAAKITLNFDANLVPFNDTRAGKNPRWHKTIRTSVDLKVDVEEGNTLEVSGHALFYLTRGDSALIPDDRKAIGFKPDSLRWWIDRWEDETIGSAGVVATARGARPALGGEVFQRSMLQVKQYFLYQPAAVTVRSR
jgi:hypothetical protein